MDRRKLTPIKKAGEQCPECGELLEKTYIGAGTFCKECGFIEARFPISILNFLTRDTDQDDILDAGIVFVLGRMK